MAKDLLDRPRLRWVRWCRAGVAKPDSESGRDRPALWRCRPATVRFGGAGWSGSALADPRLGREGTGTGHSPRTQFSGSRLTGGLSPPRTTQGSRGSGRESSLAENGMRGADASRPIEACGRARSTDIENGAWRRNQHEGLAPTDGPRARPGALGARLLLVVDLVEVVARVGLLRLVRSGRGPWAGGTG